MSPLSHSFTLIRMRLPGQRLFVHGLLGAVLLAGCRHFDPMSVSPYEGARKLEGRTLSDPALRSFLEASLGHRVAAWPLGRWDLEVLTLAAGYFHPDLAVARADWRVARAGVQTAGARPNPTLGLAPEFVSNARTAVSPWIAALHLDWPIETAGKRGHRVARAEELTRSARLGLDGAVWRVRGELRAALVELGALDARAAHLERELALRRDLLRLLEARLDAGSISRATLTPQRLAALQAAFDLAEARGLRDQARARVAASVGVPERALEGVHLVPPAPEPAEARALLSNYARRRALLGRTDVLGGLAEYAASQAALQLEIARQYPDLHLGTGYQFDQGANKWALGLVVELPLLNRNEGPIAEAEALRARASAHFEALQARVIAEVEAAAAAHASALEQLRQAEALVVERAAQRERAQRALEVGAEDRAALRAAELELESGERLRDEAQSRVLDAEARLELAVQPSVPLLAAVATPSPAEAP